MPFEGEGPVGIVGEGERSADVEQQGGELDEGPAGAARAERSRQVLADGRGVRGPAGLQRVEDRFEAAGARQGVGEAVQPAPCEDGHPAQHGELGREHPQDPQAEEALDPAVGVGQGEDLEQLGGRALVGGFEELALVGLDPFERLEGDRKVEGGREAQHPDEPHRVGDQVLQADGPDGARFQVREPPGRIDERSVRQDLASPDQGQGDGVDGQIAPREVRFEGVALQARQVEHHPVIEHHPRDAEVRVQDDEVARKRLGDRAPERLGIARRDEVGIERGAPQQGVAHVAAYQVDVHAEGRGMA
ncbi:hypothetical protein D3C86_1043080 [compost metagenome]